MERQQEYELRKKIADAIQNDVDRVFSEKLQLFNHDFYYEILFPLIVLEMNYKMKSEESLAAGLGDSNEYLILVNPLREAIYWYIHRVLISDRKISFSKKRYVPSLGEEYSFVEYVLQLGKLLRKTEEGRELFQLEMGIEEKYKDNEAFGQYEQFAEKKTSQFYFYSWNMAYKTFVNVLTDDSIEHRDFFLPTAELISSDDEIKSFALTAVKFGSIFEQLVAVIISGGEYEKVIPESWTYKVKNAISDVQISVERTLLVKTIAVFYKKHQNLLNSSATQKYLLMREKEKLLPFSEKALEIISETEDVSEEEKLLYEKMYLIMEAVKKGIFYGFWGMTNEIQKEELLNADGLYSSPLHEVTFSHKNNYSSFWGAGWLYKIQLEKEHVYFMAHRKQVHLDPNNQTSTISGIVYPADDRGLFEIKE